MRMMSTHAGIVKYYIKHPWQIYSCDHFLKNNVKLKIIQQGVRGKGIDSRYSALLYLRIL